MTEPPEHDPNPSDSPAPEPVDPNLGQPGRPRPGGAPGYSGAPDPGYPGGGHPGAGYPGAAAPGHPAAPYPVHPQAAYGPPPGAYGAPGPATPGRRIALLGPRIAIRPEPRFGVALAGLGVGLTLFGIIALGSANNLGTSSGGRSAIAIILSLAITAAAYALLWVRQDGPLVTAGVAASALGVESLLHFIAAAGHAGADASVNITALSILVWIASYLWAPGGRGHTFYLGLAAINFWFYLIFSVDKNAVLGLFLLPFARATASIDGGSVSSQFDGGIPDFNSVAVLSILLGLIYYAAAAILDRTGRPGLALPFVIGGAPAVVAGLAFAAVNAPEALEGILIIAISAVLAVFGARARRRFTTWFWTAGIGVGIIVVLVKAVGDNDTGAGISLIVIGLVVVGLATTLGQLLREPDELVQTSTGQMGPGPVR